MQKRIKLVTKLHLCCTVSCPVVFHLFLGNSHDAHEGRKLIKSIYPKNNNYILMDRAYEDDKTIALAKARGLRPVAHPKKNRNLPWFYDKQLYKQRNLIERFFLRLKRFRKVFTRYDKLDSIFISTISLAFIFDLLFSCTYDPPKNNCLYQHDYEQKIYCFIISLKMPFAL